MAIETSVVGIQGLAGPGAMDRGGFVAGALTTSQIVGGFLVARAGTLTNARLTVTTTPSGSALTVEVRKNGTSFQTLTVAVAATDSGAATFSVSVAAGDRIELVVTAANSAVAAYWYIKGSPT